MSEEKYSGHVPPFTVGFRKVFRICCKQVHFLPCCKFFIQHCMIVLHFNPPPLIFIKSLYYNNLKSRHDIL